MELQLFLDNQLVDALPLIPTSRITAEGVNEWKLILIERNSEAMSAAEGPAQFVLEGVPSRINRLLRLAEADDAQGPEYQHYAKPEGLNPSALNGFSSFQTSTPY